MMLALDTIKIIMLTAMVITFLGIMFGWDVLKFAIVAQAFSAGAAAIIASLIVFAFYALEYIFFALATA